MNVKINIQPISNVLGVLMIFLGLSMFVTALVSFYNQSNDYNPIFSSGLITFVFGLILWLYNFRTRMEVNKREGYLIVVFAWILLGLFGSLPFILSGATTSVTDALFESFSGFTATGASIFDDVESLGKGILFWRSLTHWIGGMGIIVLTVAMFPLLGIAGIELFVAEYPGPAADRLHPRIKETAKRLWFIYIGLTGFLTLLLWLEGMNTFDAVNHAFSTLSTGGFSTKNTSIAYFNSPIIEYTLALFMFIGGTNYVVIYFLLKGKFDRAWKNEEFRYYVAFIIIAAMILGLWIQAAAGGPYELNLRTGLFMLTSIVSTTAFSTADYTTWSPGLAMFFFMLLFAGGCGGSTSGGIKFIRHIVFVKNTYQEFKRLLHPRAVIRIKINNEIVPPRVITNILVFLLVYLMTLIISTLLVTISGLDFLTALSGCATALSNVGAALGELGPSHTFTLVPSTSKIVFIFLMILGRLELFTVLVLLTPFFWRSN